MLCARLSKLAYSSVLALCAALTGPADSLAKSEGVTCHLKDDTGAARAAITVTLKELAPQLRTGDPIKVEWKASPGLNFGCRTPLYLVLSTPMRTRFEGERFLAIPAGAEGPYGIKHHADQTRIFVPLHAGPGQLAGQILVKVYEAGPFQMEWALVEVPKLVNNPQARDDFAIGHDRATATTSLGHGVSFIGGNPAIVVRDQFSTETAKQIIRSHSKEFELQVFNSHYRVIDAKTGELLHERAGWDPNFSPSSRFLGAYSAGPGFEIIDLYSGQVVSSNDTLHRERGFRGNVHMAAWSPGDAFFALSVQGWGGIELQQALIDGSHRSFPDTSCHYCRGINSALRVDIEAGIASFQGQEMGWASLLDRSVGTAAAERYALSRFPRQQFEAWDAPVHERRRALKQATSSKMLAPLAKAAFFNPDDFLTGFDSDKAAEQLEANWRFPGKMRLSHLCLQDDEGKCVGRLADFQQNFTDPEDENARLFKMRFTHDDALLSASISPRDSSIQHADERLMNVRAARSRGDEKTTTPIRTVWARLASLLPDAKSGTASKGFSAGTDIPIADSEPEVSVAQIMNSLPEAAQYLRRSGSADFIEVEDIQKDGFYGLKNEARFIDPRSIAEYANWRIGNKDYWLVRSFFDYGASGRSWLFLIHGSKKQRPLLVDFTHRLRYRVGRNPSGLDEHGKIEITKERGTTMGFGGWPGSVDKVSIAFNRYLIASGLWTIDSRRWVLMYDLETDRIRFFNREIPEAPTFAELAITEDGSTIVQANTNGHLYFYDVGSEKLFLRGFVVDDELVIHDPHGYYVASPEGAHFVFVKFPGLTGYNSFHQFARTLNRPDLIRAVLDGKRDTPDPRLTPPPKISLDVDVANTERGRSAKLKWTATSAIGLTKVRVFIDGRPVGEYHAKGPSVSTEATIALLPESRWVTAVAVDTEGYESVAQGRDLIGAGRATTSRLVAIAVGTDRYDDKNIEPLSAAKGDAENFAKTVKTLLGAAYVDVEVASFLDATGLQHTLPSKIKEAVARAGDHDTIMLFAAGHGFRDESTGEFFLATRESRVDSLKETSISWAEIAAALDGAKARVIVFLDACHSGAAGNSGTNDDAVSTLLNRKAPITVIAASKGRQESIELSTGGAFTTALVKAVTTDREVTDSNRNGAIELAELYGVLKREVLMMTRGEQTPWIARNLMVGETPMF